MLRWRPFRNDRRWGFSSERLGIMFHGNTITHVDSPCHIFWDGTMYNGRPHPLVDAATGSAWAAVTAAANGIITRGVLLDIARVRDVPWLQPGQGVFPDDLEEAERRQGVRVRSGDAVLLRTGYGRVRHEAGWRYARRRLPSSASGTSTSQSRRSASPVRPAARSTRSPHSDRDRDEKPTSEVHPTPEREMNLWVRFISAAA